jgi:hypothetical protein
MARRTSNSVRGFCLSSFFHRFAKSLSCLCQVFFMRLSVIFQPPFKGFMSESGSFDEIKARLKGRINVYQSKLAPQKAVLLPFKVEIKELRARQAAYDDIRLILAEENIIVSTSTVYRFCRDVLGEKSNESKRPRSTKVSPSAAMPVVSPPINPPNPPTSIQAALQEQRRERLPGLWGRRKRGPRIADSKNL